MNNEADDLDQIPDDFFSQEHVASQQSVKAALAKSQQSASNGVVKSQ
jgi:hypothetical protein